MDALKTCFTCGEEKSHEDFHRRKKTWRLNSSCLPCEAAYARGRTKKKREQREAGRDKSVRVCTRCGVQKTLSDFRKRPDGTSGYRSHCAACISEGGRAWRLANTEAFRASCRAWQKANPGRSHANTARYRAIKLRAIPTWADHDAIARIYEAAAFVGYHVDHVVPLRGGKLVCGLHCEANLQALPPEKNMSKGNRWWPDHPNPEYRI